MPEQSAAPLRPAPARPRGRAYGVLSSRPRLRALLVSLLCLPIGAVAFTVAFGLTYEQFGERGIEVLTGFLMLDLLIGFAACLAVGPVRGSTAGNALLLIAGIFSAFAFPAWVVAAIRFGERRSLGLDAAIVSVMVLGSTGVAWWQDAMLGVAPEPLLSATVIAVMTVAVLLWGRARSTRAALVAALREQAESAELARIALARNREAELARARAEERSVLARDMHDGISHRLSVVAMHAGALASREDLSPEQVRLAASTVREAAAEAGSMLREALTALRDPAGSAPASPLPSAASPDALTADARDRGMTVALTWRGLTPEELAGRPAQAIALARVVEEILVNAAKHAPGSALEIEVSRVSGEVVLLAGNPLPAPEAAPDAASALGTGHGLIGISERACLLGGRASHGPTAEGRFEVEVRLPWA
ncbi:MAG: histidine kinase [Leucobacter sp.]